MARILVIDDQEAVRKLFRAILEDLGHQVEIADNGNTGLEAYHKSPIDLVITDILMPGKDGLEVIQELRQENPDVKIIVITSYMNEYLFKTWELGITHSLLKPFQIQEVQKVVAEALGEQT